MAAASFIDIMRTVFPVVALQTDDPGEAARPDFFGTAFGVAPGLFITAAHVVNEATAAGALAIAGPTGDGDQLVGAARVLDFELFPNHDLALLKCNVSDITLLKMWLAGRLQLLTDVSAFGYPHAVTQSGDGSRLRVVFRGYKGYVHTIREFDRLSGEPAVYEISTPFPQGMSGAPLLFNAGTALIVVGVIQGVSTIEYGEAIHKVGIAILTDEIAELPSQMLGGPLSEKLGVTAARLEMRTPE